MNILAPQIPKPAPKSLGNFVLVGLVGKARSGKDTVADYLVAKRGDEFKELWADKVALADAVKKTASYVFDVALENFYNGEKEQIQSHVNASPRQLAQFLGTESFRDIFGEWVWVAYLHRKIRNSLTVADAVVVTDMRFENEVRWICEQGGIVVYIEREAAPEVSAHSSENIPSYETVEDLVVTYGGSCIYVSNNGSIQDLYATIEARLVPLLLP